MKKIQFLGASGVVTGSSYLVTGDAGDTILIDLGMFQGTDDTENINFSLPSFDVKTLRAVFLTHAHLDHCGRLPLLVKKGFTGKIYTTDATKMITHLSLLDAAAIAQEEKKEPVLYTKEEVEKVCNNIESVLYDKPFTISDFSITFHNAGHILGSASIEISDKSSQTIVFSGDLGNSPQDLIQPTEPIARSNIVVMESTYGDTIHPQEDAPAILQQNINEIERIGGTLLIPAFSIERTQEILHIIGHLKENRRVGGATPVFLDSPMAIEVTEIFKKYPTLYNTELSHDAHPFDFPNLTCTKTVEESKAILKVKNPKIIIAGSGMMSGGRILHHLNNYISFPTTRVLIVGYQAVGTLGREILTGAKQITIYDKHMPVRATIAKIEALSSHADQPKLLKWLKYIQGVKKVFLVHGEEKQRTALAEKIKTDIGIQHVILPTRDQVYNIN